MSLFFFILQVGVTEVVLAVNYKPDAMAEALKDVETKVNNIVKLHHSFRVYFVFFVLRPLFSAKTHKKSLSFKLHSYLFFAV
jgi:hypothetical protein